MNSVNLRRLQRSAFYHAAKWPDDGANDTGYQPYGHLDEAAKCAFKQPTEEGIEYPI